MNRKILHVDLDAFFASVEQRDFPEYRGKPLIVGGTGERGVVSTCSYEARAYGVHSAMPGFQAKKLCPNGIFVRGRHDVYSAVSREIFDFFETITDKIEKVSIDEAYFDISNLYHSPEYVAKHIMKEVETRFGLTVSVGISYNKFLAKLGSDWNKPNGYKVISKDMVPDILRPLNVRKVHGLGKKSVGRLNRIGIFTINDLLQYSEENLNDFLGSYGSEIYWRIRGVDERPVNFVRGEAKSIGHETTLKEDTDDRAFLLDLLNDFALKVHERVMKKGVLFKTVTIKTKSHDFEISTRSKSLSNYTSSIDTLKLVIEEVFEHIELDKPIRLIGLTVSNLTDSQYEQLSLF